MGGPARSRNRRLASGASALTALCLAVTLVAGSSVSGASTGGSKAEPAIPASAFKDHTGVSAHTITVGNVSTLIEGLFEGAVVGVQAYFDQVNAQGGINGRKLVLSQGDDGFTGAKNKQLTQSAVENDFALVGSFSTDDSYGGTVLAANPGMPNVSVSLDEATGQLPNSFSPQPALNGWELGPLTYFKKKYPTAVLHTAALIANQTSSLQKWVGEKAAMNHLGYKVVYDPTYDITTTDFTQDVIAMKDAGVKILFLEQSPENYTAAVLKDLQQQNFHPVVVLGASTYSEALFTAAGGASAVNGAYLEQAASLYLGEDSAKIPAVKTFLSWVQKAHPGFKADLYTLYGYLSAELFTQALKGAGSDPSRGSELQQLRKITSFSGDNLVAPANPAKKVAATCYIIGKVQNGKYVRLDDPPTTGSTHGYRCDQPYYTPPS